MWLSFWLPVVHLGPCLEAKFVKLLCEPAVPGVVVVRASNSESKDKTLEHGGIMALFYRV